VTAGFDKKVVAGLDSAIPAFEQQLHIIGAALDKAALLLKNKQLRAAGVVAGISLEKHLEQVCERRQLKISRKTIADLNELLKKYEVIDFPGYRHISLLSDLQLLCLKNNKREPEAAEVADLINGVDKVIKTVF
jgi:predicted DNA-binding ribbon-helix-helix protein